MISDKILLASIYRISYELSYNWRNVILEHYIWYMRQFKLWVFADLVLGLNVWKCSVTEDILLGTCEASWFDSISNRTSDSRFDS